MKKTELGMLQILLKIRSDDPWVSDEWGTHCFFCGAEWCFNEVEHRDDCLWMSILEATKDHNE